MNYLRSRAAQDKTFGSETTRRARQQQFIKTVTQQIKYGQQSGQKRLQDELEAKVCWPASICAIYITIMVFAEKESREEGEGRTSVAVQTISSCSEIISRSVLIILHTMILPSVAPLIHRCWSQVCFVSVLQAGLLHEGWQVQVLSRPLSGRQSREEEHVRGQQRPRGRWVTMNELRPATLSCCCACRHHWQVGWRQLLKEVVEKKHGDKVKPKTDIVSQHSWNTVVLMR